jgi:hypothetical protein
MGVGYSFTVIAHMPPKNIKLGLEELIAPTISHC